MPEKDFVIWLDDRTYIRVEFVTVRGHVVSFVVRLMLIEAGREFNAARYDTAHGTPHRDVMGRRAGEIGKVWLMNLSPGQVLDLAIEDFKANYESYRAEFERH